MPIVNPKPGLEYSMDGYLKDLLDPFSQAVHTKNTSMVMVIDGKSGLGKSTLSFQIGNYLDPTFNLDKVHFTPESFLKCLAEAKKGDFIVFDEALILSSRSAMSEVNKMVLIAMSMIRSKNIFVCFNVNSIFDLDKNLALFRSDLLLHVYSENLFTRGRFCAFFRAKDGLDRVKELFIFGKKHYSYSKPKANFYGSFTGKFVLDEQEYESKKQKEINSFLNNPKGHNKTDTKFREASKKLIAFLKESGKSGNEISKICGLSDQTVYNLMKEGQNG